MLIKMSFTTILIVCTITIFGTACVSIPVGDLYKMEGDEVKTKLGFAPEKVHSSPQAQDSDKFSPDKSGSSKVASELLENKASVTGTNKNSLTPLHVLSSKVKGSNLFLQKDAPIDAQGKIDFGLRKTTTKAVMTKAAAGHSDVPNSAKAMPQVAMAMETIEKNLIAASDDCNCVNDFDFDSAMDAYAKSTAVITNALITKENYSKAMLKY